MTLGRRRLEDFVVVLPEYKPVIFKSARKTGELLGSSVVVATIQSLMVDTPVHSVMLIYGHCGVILTEEAQ